MRVLVLQHEPDDGPGYLGEALEQGSASLDIVHLYQNQPIPDVAAYDMLLVMGGEMNVYQEDKHPWLANETRVIQQAVESDKAVLGVCLGGQLLAKALGAKVHLGVSHEIGLIPLALTTVGKVDPLFTGLSTLEVVVWHDDTFDVPNGAVGLASSIGCANQAFRFGRRAYGLQFHPEVSPEMLASWFHDPSHLSTDMAGFLRDVETKAETLRKQATQMIINFLRVAERPK